MFFKRTEMTDPVVAYPPQVDPSMRRQGAAEALNLIARSVIEASRSARAETEPGKPDNFLAGQFMALGQVLTHIERERDLLQQQLMQDAGLHTQPAIPLWDEEMALLHQLPVSADELFRLAMDFRQIEPPPAPEPPEDESKIASEVLVSPYVEQPC